MNFDHIEETKLRHVERNGVDYTLVCSDPYGHWTIYTKNGKTPEDLGGTYTTVLEAEKAITKYGKTAAPTPEVKPVEVKKVSGTNKVIE